ncbi:MAG TPA: MotA/TolQ/ExbB proton channel family protein [Candidatus Krumholzibacteria bacterium]|nr:MotA/TolQ/ExbB proton channel family protein [Candidatus Krumholzibacteria bacterium]
MWQLFLKGGPVMYPLALMSVLTVAVIIEKLFSLRRPKVIQGEIVSCIESIRTPADIPLAMKICERFDTPFANIIRSGLAEANKPIFIVRQAMEDTGRREVKRLERYMVVLETAAASGPLMGLLGTVIGMIQVFSVISVSGVGQAGMLSGGIAQALITTVFGLIIAVPALIIFNFLDARIEGMVIRIDEYSHMLLKRLAAMREGSDVELAEFEFRKQ